MTQFEADTATAFVALAAAGVEVGVIEAGPRRSPRRDQRAPVAGHGADLGRARAHRVPGRHRARDRGREARGPPRPLDPGHRAARAGGRGGWRAGWRPSAAPALVSVRDLAPAVELPPRRRICAGTSPSRSPPPRRCSGRSTPSASMAVAAGLELHGRMEVIEGDPALVLDAAHNPAGAAALAEALPAVAGGRPVIALPGGARRQGRGGVRRGAGAGARGRGRDRGAGGAAGGGRAAGGRVARGLPTWPRCAAKRGWAGWRRWLIRPRRWRGRARWRERRAAWRSCTGSHYLLRYARRLAALEAVAELLDVALEPVGVVVGPALEVLEVADRRWPSSGRSPRRSGSRSGPGASGRGAARRRPGLRRSRICWSAQCAPRPVDWTISIPIETWLRPIVCRQRIRGATSSSIVPSCSIT